MDDDYEYSFVTVVSRWDNTAEWNPTLEYVEAALTTYRHHVGPDLQEKYRGLSFERPRERPLLDLRDVDKLFDLREFEMTVRTDNALKYAGGGYVDVKNIKDVREMADWTSRELCHINNLGKVSRLDLRQALRNNGFKMAAMDKMNDEGNY